MEGFFYDLLRNEKNGTAVPLKIRSYVGLISLFSVTTIRRETLEKLPRFQRRLDWFVKYRPG